MWSSCHYDVVYEVNIPFPGVHSPFFTSVLYYVDLWYSFIHYVDWNFFSCFCFSVLSVHFFQLQKIRKEDWTDQISKNPSSLVKEDGNHFHLISSLFLYFCHSHVFCHSSSELMRCLHTPMLASTLTSPSPCRLPHQGPVVKVRMHLLKALRKRSTGVHCITLTELRGDNQGLEPKIVGP